MVNVALSKKASKQLRDGWGRFDAVQLVEIEFGIEGRVRYTCKSDTCLADTAGEGLEQDEMLEYEREGLQWVLCGHCGQETQVQIVALGDSWKWLVLSEDDRTRVMDGTLTWERAVLDIDASQRAGAGDQSDLEDEFSKDGSPDEDGFGGR